MATPYFNYYMQRIRPEGREQVRLENIYLTMKGRCCNLTDFEMHSFITAWISDKDEYRGIGPKFSMALAYYENTVHELINDLNADQMKEAAIRDYILTCQRPVAKDFMFIVAIKPDPVE